MKKLILSILFLQLTILCVAQCKKTKKDGTLCKSKSVNSAGYCVFHDPSSPTCTGVKKDGIKCRMKVKAANTRCYYHK